MNQSYRIAWWKLFVLFFAFAFSLTMPLLRILTFRLLSVFVKVLVIILPIGLKPDDLLFWFFFVLMIVSLTFFRRSREVLFDFMWGLSKLLFFTEDKEEKQKNKPKRDLNQAEEMPDWADKDNETLKELIEDYRPDKEGFHIS